MITQRWLIAGRVQGVGYRAWLADRARRLELAGWVRNLEDGRVEALLSGPAEALSKLQDACRAGPPAARVEAVEGEPWDHEDRGPVTSGTFAHAATVSRPLRRPADDDR